MGALVGVLNRVGLDVGCAGEGVWVWQLGVCCVGLRWRSWGWGWLVGFVGGVHRGLGLSFVGGVGVGQVLLRGWSLLGGAELLFVVWGLSRVWVELEGFRLWVLLLGWGTWWDVGGVWGRVGWGVVWGFGAYFVASFGFGLWFGYLGLWYG